MGGVEDNHVLQVGEGSFLGRTRYFSTVDSATAMPIF
jgi:hypothetical protein